MTEKSKVPTAHTATSTSDSSTEVCIPAWAHVARAWTPRDTPPSCSSLISKTDIKRGGKRSDNFKTVLLQDLPPHPHPVPTSSKRGALAPEAGAGAPPQSQPTGLAVGVRRAALWQIIFKIIKG